MTGLNSVACVVLGGGGTLQQHNKFRQCSAVDLFEVRETAQWEELEQQALIYKYMVSGVPVPTDLILSVRRSLYNSSSSSSSSSLLSNQPTLGVWEGSFQYNQLYQMGGSGYGRKVDLEPGRCRRTDGKKWRCSKEAYPDSKYCERHMHRGRNRSRKPVEFSSSSSNSSSSLSSSSTANLSSSQSATISKSISTSDHHPNYPLLDHYSSSRPPIHTNFVDSSSYSHQTQLKDFRYLQGMKDLGEDERSAYFQLNDPYNTTQKMAAASSSSSSDHHHNFSHFNFQNLNDQFKEQKDHHKEEQQTAEGGQHCFVMGADFIKPSEETTNTHHPHKQPFHHFFAPSKATPSNHENNPGWVQVDQQQQNHFTTNPPKSPLSTQDLFQSKPRPYW
ncbi:hypothetical protein OSB04_004388 [Centaurea solstitialis]|uniref:Growth-regulating factor n=1 Tax=Centaurea solstitialis TaxID=347529 RepID=A0AA38UDE2_9ASTR|nr:hypothetical protein OSB04_004388 [Centaurea solstitialis]